MFVDQRFDQCGLHPRLLIGRLPARQCRHDDNHTVHLPQTQRRRTIGKTRLFDVENPVIPCRPREEMLRTLKDEIPSQVRYTNNVHQLTATGTFQVPCRPRETTNELAAARVSPHRDRVLRLVFCGSEEEAEEEKRKECGLGSQPS